MKTNLLHIAMKKQKVMCYLLLLFTLLISERITSQQSYTFTSAGAIGGSGPSQAQVNTAYALTNLNGLVVSTGGIQSFTVPASGIYQIDIAAASGGTPTSYQANTGGLGARMIGNFNLVAGDVLQILVGQRGGASGGAGAGGGGTYVVCNGVLLIAAGGGGGGTSNNMAANGTTATAGTNDFPGGTTLGGVNGNGGQTCNVAGAGANHGGAGAGYLTNGATSTAPSPGGGGVSFLNGGTGGTGAGVGGFGGGGGCTSITVGGGGGGGYSGGAGGQQVNYCTPGINRSGGGGGGSYNSGTNQINTGGVNGGDGKAIITSLCDVQVNGATSICAGNSTTLTSTAVSNILWSNGSTASSIVVSPQSTTVYTVSGNGTLNNCNSVIVFSVVVNPLPTLTVAVSPAILCAGSAATVAVSGASTYTWSSGPSTNTTTLSPVVTTTYNVVGTSSLGCEMGTVFTVNVNTLVLSVSGSTEVCLGKSISLTGSGGTNLNWVGFGPFPTINPLPTVATNYTLNGIDVNNCSISKVVAVTVLQNPTVTATTANTLVCKGQPVTLTAGGANSYTWSNSATTASIVVTPLIDIPYTYTVAGSDGNGCTGNASVTIKVSNCVGLNELGNGELFTRIYPNPTNGNVFMEFADASSKKIEVLDAMGRRIIFETIASQTGVVDLSGFAAGIYYLRITSGNVTGISKIAKE